MKCSTVFNACDMPWVVAHALRRCVVVKLLLSGHTIMLSETVHGVEEIAECLVMVAPNHRFIHGGRMDSNAKKRNLQILLGA